MKHVLALILAAFAFSGSTQAAPLSYRGTNPNISPDASPLNGPNKQFIANLARPKNPNGSTIPRLSEADLLKQSVISGLSSTYLALLNSSNPAAAGTVFFGDGTRAEYSTAAGIRYITFYDINGGTTSISFPI